MAIELDFRTLFESAPGLYLALAPGSDLTIVAVSDSYLRATMTKRADILGRGLFDVFPDNPDDPTATGTRNLAASIARAIATRAPDKMTIQKYDIRRPAEEGGGFEERWWSPVNTPVVEGGEVRYVIHQAEDVTALVRAEQRGVALENQVEVEQRRADVQFRELVDLAPDGVVVCDESGKIALVNVQAERMFGYTREELIGRPIETLVPERFRSKHPAHVAGMSGFEAVQRLRGWPETRGIPVIGLSAAALPRDTARAKEIGSYRYLTKPVKVDQLTAVLEELLEPAAETARPLSTHGVDVRAGLDRPLVRPDTSERFEGIVTGASSKGTWVRVFRPPVEGKLVHGFEGLDVGDHVRVELTRTDVERGFIDFVRAPLK